MSIPLNQGLEETQALLRDGYFEDAIQNFTEHLNDFPSDARAYQGRAFAHFQLKNWSAANSDFSKAMALDPDDPENWIGHGMSLAIEDKIYEAIDAFQTLLSRHPNYVRGHIQLGLLYYRLCLIHKGNEQMDLALASRPSLAERKMIQRIKAEQKVLDQKRYYKPDLEALNRNSQSFSWVQKAAKWLFKRSA